MAEEQQYCDGFLEPAHPTRRIISTVIRDDDTELSLCPMCIQDYLNSDRISDLERQVGKTVWSFVKAFNHQGYDPL